MSKKKKVHGTLGATEQADTAVFYATVFDAQNVTYHPLNLNLNAEAPHVEEPPKWAEVVLVLCCGSGKRAEAIRGDLCERFTHDCAMMSPERARLLYRARVLASVFPLLKRAAGRALKWTAILSAAKRLMG